MSPSDSGAWQRGRETASPPGEAGTKQEDDFTARPVPRPRCRDAEIAETSAEKTETNSAKGRAWCLPWWRAEGVSMGLRPTKAMKSAVGPAERRAQRKNPANSATKSTRNGRGFFYRAPCCFRMAAASRKPFFSAAARGLTPALVLALTSAPRATSSSTSAVRPHAAAR